MLGRTLRKLFLLPMYKVIRILLVIQLKSVEKSGDEVMVNKVKRSMELLEDNIREIKILKAI